MKLQRELTGSAFTIGLTRTNDSIDEESEVGSDPKIAPEKI